MKKTLLILLILVVSTFYFGITLKVGVYENPPLSYAEGGKIKGILPDIFNYITKKENINVKYIYLPFSETLDSLENDLVDIVLGAGYTEERNKIFYYNKIPFYINYGKIYTQKNEKINAFFDLKNKKIGVLKKDIFYIGDKGIKKINDEFDLNIKFKEYDTYEEIFEALSKKEIEAGVVNRFAGKLLYKKYNVSETPISFYLINVYLTYHNPELKDLISKIDRELKNLKDTPDSIYYQVINKYTHRSEIPTWVTLLLIVSIIAFILLLFIIWLMEKLIKKRTFELRNQVELSKKQKEEIERLFNSLNEYTKELNVTKEKLANSEKLLKSIIENSMDGILYVDKELNVIFANSIFKYWTKRDFGRDLKEGDNLKDIFKGEDRFFDEFNLALKNEKNFIIEKPIKRLDGSIYWVSNNYYPIYNDKSEIIGAALISRDITELKENEEKLRHFAYYDSLTKIFNRRAGFYFMEELILLSKREKTPVTIGFIDVDNLKTINDKYGHAAGDKALQIIANVIKKHIRKSDIVARYGGDEFFVFLYNCKLEDAKRIEKNIIDELTKISKKENINYSVSFGFVEYNHEETLDSIISKADEVMYENKKKKRISFK
ncbi:GGDEF domain-containing protein [Marinitoga lauensis]|uniref:GGDEF domain-containing protein n=1 Tax=Marinitoga lauensis TaxID=2201189 RepID=UPI0010119270|nr:GGDEF domain-containing protein [Marinitoga lauensis]